MPLSDAESRCIDAVCRFLDREHGGTWQLPAAASLDDAHPNLPSPEAIVTDGTRTAAIEVTELRGGETWNEYHVGLGWLRRGLQPPRPGKYYLYPAVDFRVPMKRVDVPQLQQAIAAAAEQTNEAGDVAPVLVPRSATVHVSRKTGIGYIFCSHDGGNAAASRAAELVEGAYWLEDDGSLEHRFLTEEGVERAALSIATACRTAANDGSATAQWFDEWELELDDPSGTGVWPVAVTDAIPASLPISQDVRKAVDAKSKKFAGQRWADLHVLALDARTPFTAAEDVATELADLNPVDLANFDLILQVDGASAERVWPV